MRLNSLVPAGLSLLLCSCAHPTKQDVDDGYAKMSGKISADHASIVQPANAAPLLHKMSGNWLGVKVKPLAQEASLPPAFKSPVTLRFPGRSNLRTISERISKVTGIPVTLKPDVFMPIASFVGGQGAAAPTPAAGVAPLPPTPISMLPVAMAPSNTSDDMELNFVETPLREVLNQIGSRFGINWTFKEPDGIVFSRLTTKTFVIKVLPGDSAMSSSLGKGASGSGTSATGVSFTSNGQVSMNSNYSVWSSIQGVLDTMKSPAGKFFISQASGTVTMTDTREVLDGVEKYIDSENDILTRQVAVRVEVLSVSATDNSELGINWNVVFTRLTRSIPQWGIALAPPATVTSNMAGALGLTVLAPPASGSSDLPQLSGSEAIVNALAGIGKVTDHQTYSAVTLNRTPVPLGVTDQVSYLARTTPGGNAGVGGSTLPGLEPGLLSTGFLSNILPSVLPNNEIMLQFSLDSSQLKNMGIISTGQGITQQAIQTPEVSATQTASKALIKSGSSIVLTGFERDSSRYNQRGLTENIGLGGSYSGRKVKESIVIILTPVIIGA